MTMWRMKGIWIGSNARDDTGANHYSKLSKDLNGDRYFKPEFVDLMRKHVAKD